MACMLTRFAAVVLTFLMVAAYGRPHVHAGAVVTPAPGTIAPDWVTIAAAGGDIVDALARVPHDPNPLGVFPANFRRKPYPEAFRDIRFTATDGTPLAGRLAVHQDNRPRPGALLVHGFTQTKDSKFIVELAELFARNGWHVLAMDMRDTGRAGRRRRR